MCRLCGYSLNGYQTKIYWTMGFNDYQSCSIRVHDNCDDVPEWHAKQVQIGLSLQSRGLPLWGMPIK